MFSKPELTEIICSRQDNKNEMESDATTLASLDRPHLDIAVDKLILSFDPFTSLALILR